MKNIKEDLNENNIKENMWWNITVNIYDTPLNNIGRNIRLNISANVRYSIYNPIEQNIKPKAVRP